MFIDLKILHVISACVYNPFASINKIYVESWTEDLQTLEIVLLIPEFLTICIHV